jgi:DNA-binding transcriptional regulator YiaG
VPNLASVLKEEIARLAKRATRAEIESMKKSSSQHRKHIAALKREVSQLQRQVAQLVRRADTGPKPAATEDGGRPPRFQAKGLRSHRSRLGLSASEFGRLAGVSAQTVYNWEREAAHPRKEQLARLVELRSLGKREAGRRLAALGGNGSAKRSPRAATTTH